MTHSLANFDFTRCVRPDGSVYGSRGKCRKGSETAPSAPMPKKKKLLQGQELANAIMQYVNIENRVRANHKGLLTTKKAKAELEAELRKEGVPNKSQLREMSLAQRESDMGYKSSQKLKDLNKARARLKELAREMKGKLTKKRLSEIKQELKKLEAKVKG